MAISFVYKLADHEGILTVTLLTVPYISHTVFESNAALHVLVCSVDHNTESSLSRLSAGDVQLLQVSQMLPISCTKAY